MARILLAEDDQASLDLVRRALEMDGHAIVTAGDGSDALEKLGSAGPFDVLVADVHMPGLDGIQLSARALASLPKLRLVLISADQTVFEKARMLRASAMRIAAKPFTLEQIRSEVRAVLEP